MAEPPRELQRRLLKQADDLAMVPAVAMQALEIAKDPDCTISKFASVVERDVKLASDVLALANSVRFSPPSPIVSLHQAVVRLGFRQCKNLILTSSIAGVLRRISIQQQQVRDQLWQHSFTTALVGLQINRSLNLGFQGEEFTAGLIHDLGRTLLAILEPDRFTEFDPLDFNESENILDRERSIVGTDHCTLGAWFVKWSGLPEALSDVIYFHHAPRLAQENAKLVALTAAADHMANHLQREGTAERYMPMENAAAQLLAELSDPSAHVRFAETAHAQLEQTAADASAMATSLR